MPARAADDFAFIAERLGQVRAENYPEHVHDIDAVTSRCKHCGHKPPTPLSQPDGDEYWCYS